jgi:hypothetical protein
MRFTCAHTRGNTDAVIVEHPGHQEVLITWCELLLFRTFLRNTIAHVFTILPLLVRIHTHTHMSCHGREVILHRRRQAGNRSEMWDSSCHVYTQVRHKAKRACVMQHHPHLNVYSYIHIHIIWVYQAASPSPRDIELVTLDEHIRLWQQGVLEKSAMPRRRQCHHVSCTQAEMPSLASCCLNHPKAKDKLFRC